MDSLGRDGAQYLLPAELADDAVSGALAPRFKLRDGRPLTTERTFYDTFDGRLHAADLVAVHAEGRLVLAHAETLTELAAAERPDAPERIFATELEGERLRELLEPLVEVRALLPIARTRSRVRRLGVLDDHAKTVVRLILEEPVARSGRSRVALSPRLIVAPVRGYDRALDRVRSALEARLGLVPAQQPLHDEAVAAAGGRPGGVRAKPELTLEPAERADRAAAAVLAQLLGVIEANVAGAVADLDSEFLHDLRVAVRRTRSVQRQLAGVFPPEPLGRFRAEFRWLQQVTGPARDLDVQLLEFDALRSALAQARAGEVEPLRGVLEERRLLAHRRAARALRSRRTSSLLESWAEFLEGLHELPEDDRPDAADPIGELAAGRIRAVHRRMVKLGRAIDDDSPPEALHDLRKKGKELRYLLELFGGLYARDAVKPMVGALKDLQDTLGRFQDREIQAQTLRERSAEVGARDDGAAALMAMGVLVELLERDQAAARSQFAERFAAFSSKPARALLERALA